MINNCKSLRERERERETDRERKTERERDRERETERQRQRGRKREREREIQRMSNTESQPGALLHRFVCVCVCVCVLLTESTPNEQKKCLRAFSATLVNVLLAATKRSFTAPAQLEVRYILCHQSGKVCLHVL